MKEKEYDSSDDENSQENLNKNDNLNIVTTPYSIKSGNLNIEQKEIELQPIVHKSLDETIKKLKEKEKSKEIHNSYLYNIKNYIFFLAIMLVPSINFSYLYLPFVFFGIIYIFLMQSNNYCSNNFKFTIEIIIFIYSILLTAFKVVSLILIKKDNSFIYQHKDLFLDLGICYFRDTDSFFYFLMTFLGEAIMIFFSLYSIFISKICREFKPVNDTSLMENKFWKNRNLLMLNYIFILSFSVFNVSFLTLFYMCVLQIVFFLDSLANNRNKIQGFFIFICFVFLALILSQVTAINVLNIPRLQKEILHDEEIKEKDSELFEKVFSIWTKIGINFAYHHKLIYILKEWIGYFLAICSLLSLTFSIKTIKVNMLSQRKKNRNIDINTAKTIIKQREEEEEKEKKLIKNEKIEKMKNFFSKIVDFCKKVIRNILDFITSPAFIIQFCRIMSIAWMYFYRNFYSLGIFITLFFSFLFINTKSNKYLTIFLLAPMIFISLACFHFSNINGYFENYEEVERIKYLHFGLGKYEYSFLEYYLGNIFYIFTMFLLHSFYHTSKNKEDKKNRQESINLIQEESNKQPLLLDYNNENLEEKKIEIVLDSENKKKKKKKKAKIQDLTFINIILKAIFSNIDKITLIVMYFVAVKSINIVHLFLVIIFLIQILLPNKIKNCFEIILCLIQFLFLFEIITDLLKVYYLEDFNKNKDFMNFLLIYTDKLSDNNIEIFIYAVVYCLYFQYQIYNFPFLKRIIENNKITLGNFIEEKLQRFERIRHILFLIGNIILELYIWILIGLFIFTSCFFEISLIFAFKLAWFLLLSYNFLKKIQSPENGVEYSPFWHGLFLFFCCINTLSVYLYQFISDDYLYYYENIFVSKNFFVINFPNIGLTMYNRDDLYLTFLPHFGIIFIAVLFIREITSQLKKLSKENKKKKKKVKEVVDDIDIQLKDPRLREEEKDILKAKKFEKNKQILKNLSIRFFIINIMRIITKFYWLLLFLTIGIIFCFYDLSYSMTIYIIIFDITFIGMFHRIIKKLSNYISRPSYFISKVIRYSLVEVPIHIKQNKRFRSVAFRFLLSYSFIFFILLYLYGVFDLFQNGCNPEFFKGCEKRNDPIFENGGNTEIYIKAYSYLFGIYVNIQNEGLMNVAWIHILLSVLIGFDVYAQKLENKFTDDYEYIKAQMQKLNNENSTLFHHTLMADTNILIKLGLDLAGINANNIEDKIRESIDKIKEASRHGSEINTGRQKSMQEQQEIEEINSVNTNENLEENAFLRNNRIKLFVGIFAKANDNQQTLSDTNNATRLIFFVKKIFEEIIIFLLICIALTKLNVLSYIYLIYSAYLTKTQKTMKKFYVLYCFLLALILIQSIIYISNISDKTCPHPKKDLLEILEKKLNIPWYKNRFDLIDKYAFFFGFGVNKTQISLILLEFAQVMVIYIYLDFFSYSVYQDVTNKGERKGLGEKFNFGSIKLSPIIKKQVKYMNQNLFEQFRDCLRINFELDIGENLSQLKGKLNIRDEEENDKNDLENDNNIVRTNNEEINKLILYKTDYYKKREKNRREGTDNIPESNFVKSFQEIIYLYLHCFILLFVIIIALMITGMLSIFYIIVCFYYLLNADKIFLGQIYGYPVAIKKLLKICVIGDIIIQTIYQMPYISPDQNSVIQKIFDVLGLIKLIDYEADEGKNIKLISSGIFEVIGKPLIYLFLSLQIIIYKSKDFKKYYLTFLLGQQFEFTKNSLINTFKFNNLRIDAFKNSMNLRVKSEQAMEELELILEDWNTKLKIGGGNLYEEPEEEPLEFIRRKERETKKKEEEKKEKDAENLNINNEKDENEIKTSILKERETNLMNAIKEKGTLGLFQEMQKNNRKIVEPEEIKKKLKKILLSGYFTRFYIWFSKHALYYKSMEEKNKLDYEKNIILGNIEMKCYLKEELEKQLNLLNLNDFDTNEVELLEDFAIKYKKGKLMKELERFKEDIRKDQLETIRNQIKEKRELEGIKENDIENTNIDNINNNTGFIYEKDLDKVNVVYTIKKGDIEININTMKFKQFKYLLETKLFTTYFHTSYQIKSIISNLEHFLSNHFDYFCYGIMLIEHMINSSFLTFFYPISIFCYALLENPRPKKLYWEICIYYTIFILSIKFFFQLKLFNTIFEKENYEKFLDALYNYKVGIAHFNIGFGLEFFRYIAFDAFVLIILSLNRNLLISNGLWEKREEQIENIFAAQERVEANKDREFKNQNDIKELIKEFLFLKPQVVKKSQIQNAIENQNENNINNLLNEENLLIPKKEKENGRKLKFHNNEIEAKYDEGNRSFFEKLFPKIRNEKPGDDFYPFYSSVLALIIIYILFFFTKMDQDKTYGPVNLDTTQFSGNMVLFLLLHVVILVYDRGIYICQNKNHLKYKYFIYKKNEKGVGELLSREEFEELKTEIKNEKEKSFYIPPSGFKIINENKNYNLFYVQTELFNKPLLHKYILHIFSTIVCHIFVFIYFPMKGNFNLLNTIYCIKGEECNDFRSNAYTIIFYLLYLIYLYLSSLQIRLGYFDIKRKSLFKNNTTFTNTFSKVFNAIPFLPNIRNTVDWTFTSTCLDLFQWNKFESIYDTIFDTYCDAEGNDENPIGEKVSKKSKIIMGGLLSFGLIFILVIPLVLFSSLNPTNKLNNLNSAKLNVDLTFTYENGVILNYNLFENTRAKTISEMFKDGDQYWKSYDYDDCVQTRNFNKKQIQIVRFSETSDRNWDLAEPHIKDLIELLNITEDNGIESIELNIQTEFERALPAEAQTVSHSFTIPVFSSSMKEDSEGFQNTLKLKNAFEKCQDTFIQFNETYAPPLRLTAGEEISEIEDDKYILKKDVQLGFQGCKKENETIGDKTEEVNSYLKSYFTFKSCDKNGNWEGAEFHIFNDKISETTSGYSVLTFYLTFVLVAGSYVQEFLASEPEKIMFTDLPHPEKIVNLCEGIKISRYSYDFKKEEYLFTILIELMRSPDYLKLLTQSSIDHFKIRKKNTPKEENENDNNNNDDEYQDIYGKNNEEENNNENQNENNNVNNNNNNNEILNNNNDEDKKEDDNGRNIDNKKDDDSSDSEDDNKGNNIDNIKDDDSNSKKDDTNNIDNKKDDDSSSN